MQSGSLQTGEICPQRSLRDLFPNSFCITYSHFTKMCLCLFWSKCKCKIFGRGKVDRSNQHLIDDPGHRSQTETRPNRLGMNGKRERNRKPPTSLEPANRKQHFHETNTIASMKRGKSLDIRKANNKVKRMAIFYKPELRRMKTTQVRRVTRGTRKNTGF